MRKQPKKLCFHSIQMAICSPSVCVCVCVERVSLLSKLLTPLCLLSSYQYISPNKISAHSVMIFSSVDFSFASCVCKFHLSIEVGDCFDRWFNSWWHRCSWHSYPAGGYSETLLRPYNRLWHQLSTFLCVLFLITSCLATQRQFRNNRMSHKMSF